MLVDLGNVGPSAKIADGDVRLSPCNYLYISVIIWQKIEIRASIDRQRGFVTRDRIEEKRKKIISGENRGGGRRRWAADRSEDFFMAMIIAYEVNVILNTDCGCRLWMTVRVSLWNTFVKQLNVIFITMHRRIRQNGHRVNSRSILFLSLFHFLFTYHFYILREFVLEY